MAAHRRRNPRATRSLEEREEDLRIFASLLRQGKAQCELVVWVKQNRAYTLTKQTICADVQEMRKRWREAANTDMDAKIRKQLACIDAQEVEAWTAWERSKGEVLETTQEKGDTGGTGKSRAVVKKTISHGDPRYMAAIMACVDARNKLFGIGKSRVELSGPGGGPVQTVTNISPVSPERVEALYRAKLKRDMEEMAKAEATNHHD